ncbi:hypothetical protein ACFVJH_28590 [Streptomyces decoyicus]|uniref:hypothetical protein n=1 Tax=Streptomyces decoyicus TaxID=249567 RepID=UPI0036258AE6
MTKPCIRPAARTYFAPGACRRSAASTVAGIVPVPAKPALLVTGVHGLPLIQVVGLAPSD